MSILNPLNIIGSRYSIREHLQVMNPVFDTIFLYIITTGADEASS